MGVTEVREIPFYWNGIDRLREVTDVALDDPDIIFQDQDAAVLTGCDVVRRITVRQRTPDFGRSEWWPSETKPFSGVIFSRSMQFIQRAAAAVPSHVKIEAKAEALHERFDIGMSLAGRRNRDDHDSVDDFEQPLEGFSQR